MTGANLTVVSTDDPHEIIDLLADSVAQRERSDARVTALLTLARERRPPIPLEVLAQATGLSVSGVSVRVARARKV